MTKAERTIIKLIKLRGIPEYSYECTYIPAYLFDAIANCPHPEALSRLIHHCDLGCFVLYRQYDE